MAKHKPPQFEKEKIIDRRIGIKLDGLFWPIDRPSLNDILTLLNYKDIALTPTNSFSASKHNTDFYSDYQKLVFGFHNLNIISLIEAQKEFFSVVHREYKTDLSKNIKFYEIECVSNFITEKNTSDVYFELSKKFNLIDEIEAITKKDLRLNKMEFSEPGPINTINWFQIEISPKIESDDNTYHCRLVCRDKKPEPVYQVLRNASEYFEKIIDKIE